MIDYNAKKSVLMRLTAAFENHLAVDSIIPAIPTVLSINKTHGFQVDYDTDLFTSTIVNNKLIFRFVEHKYSDGFYLFFLLRSSGVLELTINKLLPTKKWCAVDNITNFLNKDFHQLIAQHDRRNL